MLSLLTYLLLATPAIATDDCARASFPTPENFELALTARFFARAADASVPAGVASGGWFVAPGGDLCGTGEDSIEVTLFNGSEQKSVEVEVPPELCEFVRDARARMRANGTLRLSIFGERRVDFIYGHEVGVRVRANRACTFANEGRLG